MIRRPHSRLLLAVAALFAVGACEKESITLDSGDPSSLEVRVYVDANGNGEYDAGDQAIASAEVAASGPVELTETTGGDGLAAFEGLVPGSYTLSLSANAPAGAVLGSATHPVVVADFRGGSLSAEYRFAFEPGAIIGQLYRDDNDNDQYDPGTDLPAAGITVTAERTGGGETTTLTGDDGSWALEGLRPGTYTVTFGLPEDAELEGGDSFTVDVDPAGIASLNTIFTGELVIDIADARAAPAGQTVTVEATVIWQKGWDDRSYYIQDETGGINVFDSSGPDLELGDVVRITGTRGAFSGEIQISPVASLEVLSNTGTPVPAPVTADDILSGDYAGELVSIDGTVTDIQTFSFDNHLVTLEDGDGTTFEVYVDSRTGIGSADWEIGTLYGVTGVVETDGDLLPRFPSDVQKGGATVAIADARNADGATLAIQGVLTFVHPDGRTLFLQDATGGISVFSFDLDDLAPGGLARGDLVRIVGTIGGFSGEIQIEDLTSIDVRGSVPVPSPVGMTAAEIDAGENQGELAVATGTVTNIQTFSFDNHLVTLEDAAGDDFNVYVDSRNGMASTDWTVGTRYRVTGPLGNNENDTPSERIEPRGPEDQVELAPGDPISIAEARAMVGETVTVQGVVSRTEQWDDRDGWFQDATGGLYASGGSADFDGVAVAGDEVLVTGEIVEAFGGQIEIEPTSVTVVGSPGAPAPTVATGAQVNALFYQGILVELTGTVLSVEEVNDFGTQEVVIATPDGAEVQVYVDNRTGLAADDWTVGEQATIVAPVGRFFENVQLEVMRGDDVTFGS